MRPHFSRPEVGKIYETNQGCQVQVIDYIAYSKILVKFLDESAHEKFVGKKELLRGAVKNPFFPEVRGVGFFGVGPYTGKISFGSSINTKEYSHWSCMLTRSYCPKYQEKFPTYLTCSVDPQWHNFQEFAEWCQWQIGFTDENSVLDKDLLFQGNKIYSPETCVFLPPKLNNLIVSQVRNGKDTPAGVSFQESSQKYIVSCAIDGKNKNLGRYKCPVEAFSVYREFKENLVKEKAYEYRDKIDDRAFYALMNYKAPEVVK